MKPLIIILTMSSFLFSAEIYIEKDKIYIPNAIDKTKRTYINNGYKEVFKKKNIIKIPNGYFKNIKKDNFI